MRHITAKPLLLIATLALVAAAILFLETRFDSASPEASTQPVSQTVEAEPPEAPTPPPEQTEGAGEMDEAEEAPKPDPPKPDTPKPDTPAPDPTAERLAEKEAEYERAAEIVGSTGFVNTDGVSIEENLGEKVILLDFWTYSCYNCQNTQPYLNAWQEEYADDDLLIIGVHKPEFEFEKDYAGVVEAVGLAGITYPVVLDNNDATWNAYDQRFWPTMYLIDSDGFVRYKHIGEGAYDETEAKIQELLAERDRINGASET